MSQSASRAKRDRNNLGSGVGLMPALDCSSSTRAAFKKNVGRHDHAEVTNRDDHPPRTVASILGNFPQKHWQRHTPSLPLKTPSGSNGPQTSLRHNELTGVIDRLTGKFRQVAEQLSRIGSAFARWYWNRVKEIPLVFAAFTAGCVVEAVFITVPSLAHQVLARL